MTTYSEQIHTHVDITETRKLTVAKLAKLKKHAEIMVRIRKVLKSFHGKKITARLISALEKEFGVDSGISFNDLASMRYIELWGDNTFGVTWEQKLSVFLGYFGTNDPKNVDLNFPFDYDQWAAKHGIPYQYEGTIADTEKALRNIEQL